MGIIEEVKQELEISKEEEKPKAVHK